MGGDGEKHLRCALPTEGASGECKQTVVSDFKNRALANEVLTSYGGR